MKSYAPPSSSLASVGSMHVVLDNKSEECIAATETVVIAPAAGDMCGSSMLATTTTTTTTTTHQSCQCFHNHGLELWGLTWQAWKSHPENAAAAVVLVGKNTTNMATNHHHRMTSNEKDEKEEIEVLARCSPTHNDVGGMAHQTTGHYWQ